MNEDKPTKRGRPTKGPETMGDYIGLRAPKALKESLEAAARTSNRSLSTEAQFRLEQSFQEERYLGQALELIYGRELAGVLTLIGDAMKDAGKMAAWASTQSQDGMVGWLDDPFAFDQAETAAATVLRALRPNGDPNILRHSGAAAGREARETGALIAAGALLGIKSGTASNERIDSVPDAQLPENSRWNKRIRALLGPIASRVQVADSIGESNDA